MNYHLDYETRSRADLKKVGAYRYACDPSTRILMFAIARGDEEPVLWMNPEFDADLISDPCALLILDEALRDPTALLWAHNAEFERAVSRYRMKLDIGFDPPPTERWRCTAALARKAGLRASLANVAEDLNLGQKKWGEGYQLIRLFSIPQEKTGEFTDPMTEPAKFARFGDYCLQDVRSEREVHQRLKPFELKTSALETFLFDARMNDRGLPLNMAALRHADAMIDRVQARVTAEFQKLTGLNPTQRDKVKAYLEGLGLKLANMQSKTTDDVISYHDEDDDGEDMLFEPGENPTDIALKALALYKQVSYAAVKKVKTMLACACSDGFARGMFLYHGAGTGRWSGVKLQPQNFKKPTIRDADGVYAMLCAGCTEDDIDSLYGNPLEAIANCIRNFIHDPTGPMFDADYASIEARIVCWLAGQEDALDRFRKGVDSYILMASQIYGVPAHLIKNPSTEREVGKRAVLGCGFGVGWEKFQATLWALYRIKVSDEVAQRAVQVYRATNEKVADRWSGGTRTNGLWGNCDDAARKALLSPGERFNVGKYLAFEFRTVSGLPYLLIHLPSKRVVAYPHPKVETLPDDDRENVTYYGHIPGTTKWGRIKLYGGKFAENCIAEGTEVLTKDRGWVHIEEVTCEDRVWDGDEWVGHDGVIMQGDQQVVPFAGVLMTPDHKVFEEIGCFSAKQARTGSALKRGLQAWRALTHSSKV